MKKLSLFLALSLFMLVSCNDTSMELQESGNGDTNQPSATVDDASLEGVVRIKFSTDLIQDFKPVITRSGISTGIHELDALASKIGIKEMKPTFPVGGKFEKRHREFGLHLWYDVKFEENMPTSRALITFEDIEGIDLVEPIYEIKRVDGLQEPTLLTADLLKSMQMAREELDGPEFGDYFDDEFLPLQWHYNNQGYYKEYRAGADINAYKGWDIETGSPDVIVAINDGGIQYDHPDIAQNMWINYSELNGTEGIDDDNNNFVDDIYGYNFVMDTGQINPHAHGTHVAGTVAAVNNNGIGVVGIAGGNGSPASGIRLMSCQLFDTYGAAANGAAAFVYSCDNGAVISQNSWVYGWGGKDQTISEADRTAIDYFIKYAGLDENNNQVGPMRGGLVIFAAGNDNVSGKLMPAAYNKVLAVTSFAPNFAKSWFSNYGTWCDIAAPGGDDQFGNAGQILSTLPGDGYGFMQGTSMACPHVSGVAALVVSKFGKPGFTADELRERLLRGTNNINSFIPDYGMGIGYINAQKALSDEGEIAPDRVHDLRGGKLTFEQAELIWSITADGDNGRPERYEVAWSTTPLWDVDMKNLPADAQKTLVRVPEDKKIGDELHLTIRSLEVNQKYYFSIVGVDKDGNQSQSTTLIGTPMENRPPVIEGLPESTIVLKRTQLGYIALKVYDPEGYNWSYSVVEGSGALKVTRTEEDQLIFMFDALKAAPGSYKAELLVGDPQGLTQKAVIPYRILENNKPKLAQDIEAHTFQSKGETRYYNLNTYFTDADEDQLVFDVVADDPSIVRIAVEDGVLKLVSSAYGSTAIHVIAIDPAQEQAATSFQVVCRNPEQKVDLYPTPVQRDGQLNIRMGADFNGIINLMLHNSSGAKVFSERVRISSGQASMVDISKLNSGNYRVTVIYGSHKFTQNITKL